MIDMVA